MGPKKILMKCSAKELIAKSAVNKKKSLPKLKVILANPYQTKYKALVDRELSEFIELISTEIISSGTSGTVFARKKNITLGLGASLRAIKNKLVSCVFVSRSIKPKFIVEQIASYSKQLNNSVPVFVVDDLETICLHLFLIKALVFVFPKSFSGEIRKWILKRTLISGRNQKIIQCKQPDNHILQKQIEAPIDLSGIYLTKQSNGTRAFVPDVVVNRKEIKKSTPKDWTGDFISFSNKNESYKDELMDELDEEFKRNHNKVLETIEKLVKNMHPAKSERIPKAEIKPKCEPVFDKKMPKDENTNEEWENDSSYISLEVHKIQPNPNRKPKNKRKNKNKI